MGSLAGSVFSVMLGWIRTAVSYLWGAASTPEGGRMLRWLTENWLLLAVILSLGCMAIDFIVHLLRWQPYKVWASFFRRLTGRQVEEAPPARASVPRRTVHRQWIYADGTERTEAVAQEDIPPEEEAHPWTDVTPVVPDYELDQEAYRRQFARPESREEENPPAPALDGYPQMNAESEVQMEPEETAPVRRTPRRARGLSRESTRAAFQQLFSSSEEDELDLRYRPHQPAVDKAQAYNKPYYPPQWKPPADAEGAVRND